MATKCYTDAEIAAIIAAASGGSAPEIQMLALMGETDGFGNARELDTTPRPVARLTPSLAGSLTQNTQLSPAARLALAPTLSPWDRNQFLSGALFEKYPELFEQIPTRQNNTIGPPIGGTTPVLGAPTPAQQPQPTNTTTQAGTPDAIFEPGQPAGGSSMDNFSCPTNSLGCLEAIPRTDAVDLYSTIFDPGKTSDEIAINLDDARGMLMQDICAMVNVVVNTAVTPVPTSVEQAQFYQQLFFLGNWTLRFRDTDVPGFKNRPLSDIAEKPGCCDDPCARVGCTVPEYGGMGIEFDFVDIPAWVDRVELLLRVNFTGCPQDSHSGCGCGGSCGGNSRVDNPYIRVGALV